MSLNGIKTIFEYFYWGSFLYYLALSAILSTLAVAVPTGKKRIPLRVAAAAACTIFNTAALYVSSRTVTAIPYEIVNSLICVLFMIVCSVVCGERKAYRVIAFPLMAVNVFTVIDALVSNAAFFIHSSEQNLWKYITNGAPSVRYISLLILTGVLLLILIFEKKNGIELERREGIALISAFFLSTVSIIFVGMILRYNRQYVYEKIIFRNTTAQSIVLSVSVLACTVILCVSFYVMTAVIVRNRRLKAEQAIIAQKTAGQSELVEEFSKKDEAISKMRHDCANILGTVDGLLAAGKYEEAHGYIREHTETLAADSAVSVRTDNVYLNAIIGYKTAQAKDRGIDVSVYSVSTVDFPDNSDLCSLIGNMLDNATTAACECEDGGEIRLDICRDGEGYSISVLNTVPSPVMQSNPRLETTKADRAAHGLGTKIIREIADKYYGSVDWYDTSDGKFCCRAVVYPEKPF